VDRFSLNGVWSTEFNIQVMNIQNRYSIPKKQYESIEVPGRTGNLLIDTGATLNKDITIECCLDCTPLNDEQINLKMKVITNWLIGAIGYQDLVFSDGGCFKAIAKDIVVDHRRKDNIFIFNIVFECYEVM
jgi:hypothetical protein